MFKRTHQDIEGTGIISLLLKVLIENAGGKIELDNKEGKGATFKVYLLKLEKLTGNP